jgi:hypothetical protein
LSVDEGLHVEAVTYSRLRLVHYFYSTQKTPSNRCQPWLTLLQEKGCRDQAIRAWQEKQWERLQVGSMRMRGLFSLLWGRRPAPESVLTAPDDAAATLMSQGKERQFIERDSVRLSNSR